MTTRRVVFVNRYCYPDHSATSQLLSDLAFHLAARGTAVTVVTGSQVYDDPAARLPRWVRVRGVDIHRVRTTRFGRSGLVGRAIDYLTFYWSAGWTLLRLLRGGDVVIAMTDPPLISVVAAAAARVRGATLVNWIQDLFPEIAVELEVPGAKVAAPLLKRLRDASMRAAARNIVIGEGMAAKLLALGVDRDRLGVIHNWCCSPELRPLPAERVALRGEWRLSGKFVVGYSGNMGRVHDVDTILAAAQVLAADPRIVFLFIGDGARRPLLQRRVDELNLGNVLFKPYQPLAYLSQSLAVADVHLVSLRPELEGLVVPSKFYGIAAAGRAVINIGRPDGEVACLIEQFGCGVTVAPGDARRLSEVIRDFAGNPAIWREMGGLARRLHEERFDRAVALERWARALPGHSGCESEVAVSHIGNLGAE